MNKVVGLIKNSANYEIMFNDQSGQIMIWILDKIYVINYSDFTKAVCDTLEEWIVFKGFIEKIKERVSKRLISSILKTNHLEWILLDFLESTKDKCDLEEYLDKDFTEEALQLKNNQNIGVLLLSPNATIRKITQIIWENKNVNTSV